jgi:hypothetical protein
MVYPQLLEPLLVELRWWNSALKRRYHWLFLLARDSALPLPNPLLRNAENVLILYIYAQITNFKHHGGLPTDGAR